MKTLRLVRDVPGPAEQTRETGGVAEAVVYSDGRAVLHWLTEPRGTEFYDSEADMRAVREASGRSRFTETGKLNLPLAAKGSTARPLAVALAELQEAAETLVRRAGSWMRDQDSGRLSQEPAVAAVRGLIAQAGQIGACRVTDKLDDLLADLRDDLISLGPFLDQLAELADGHDLQPDGTTP
jgi:hypothetical protein